MTKSQPNPPVLFTLDGILYLLFRRKWIILLGFLLGIAAAVGLYLVFPQQYVSEAKLLVRYVTDSTSLDPQTEDGDVFRPDRGGAGILMTEMEILSSQDLVQEVIQEVGLTRFANPKKPKMKSLGWVTKTVMEGLQIESSRHSSIIKLSFVARDAELAHDMLDVLVQRYLEKHQRVHRAAGSYEFFSQQTDQKRSALATTEQELTQLKARHGVVTMDEAKLQMGIRKGNLRDRMEIEAAEIAASNARIALIQDQLGLVDEPAALAKPEEVSGGLGAAAARGQLSSLYAREAALLQSYTPKSLPVISLRMLIAEAEKQAGGGIGSIGASRSVLVNPTQDLGQALVLEQATMSSSRARLVVMSEQAAEVEVEIQALNAAERRINELERKKMLQEASYVYFSESLEKARIDSTLAPSQLSNINVVQPATLPVIPEGKGLRNTMALVLFLGLAGGGGLALLLELFAGRLIRRPLEVQQALDLPTLMSLPRDSGFRYMLGTKKESQVKRLGTGSPSDAPPTEHQLRPLAREYFEALFHRIETTGVLEGEIPHIIGITSCGLGAGATTVATGLGMVVSQQEGEKVLLVEATNGTASIRASLGVTSPSTLEDVLTNGKGTSTKVQEGLYLLSAGKPIHEMVRHSLGRRFRDLVEHLKTSRFTSVIVDLPPLSETSPTLQMAGLLDGVVIVVEQGKVSQDQGQRAVELLEKSGANVVGVVLNKKRDFAPSWIEHNA